jgi:Putative rRNA methylase
VHFAGPKIQCLDGFELTAEPRHQEYLDGEKGCMRLVCFNLGYLPGSSKELVTKPDTTLAALDAALEVVMVGGLVSIAVYVGHEGMLCQGMA